MSEAIVIGAGHNGLVCAALLAQSGRKVTVVEKRDVVGGLCAPVKLGKDDSYTVPGLFHETGGLRPALVSALGLTSHGLKLRAQPAPVLATSAEHKGVVLHADPARSAQELDALEKGDADGYREWRGFLSRIGPFVQGVLDAPPPALSPASLGELFSLGRTGLALRRLGKDDMIELMRVAPMCAADWLQELFASPLVPAALSSPAIQHTWYGPWSAGTAANLLLFEAARGPGTPGGGAQLVLALEKLLKRKNADIKTSSPVTEIQIEDGRARGVTLADGTELKADVVACACDPKTALLDLVPPAELPVDTGEQLRVVRARGTTALIHLALDGKLVFRDREDERIARASVGADVDELERAADAIKYRQLSERPHLDVWVPSVEDASCAPDGNDVVSLTVCFAPHDLDGGWDDEARERLLDGALTMLEEVAPGARELVTDQRVLAPPDLEEEYGLAGGHMHHAEHALDQLVFMRPAPHVARYATPIDGLFLCGSGSHPGGGVTGQPGALAAQRILKG